MGKKFLLLSKGRAKLFEGKGGEFFSMEKGSFYEEKTNKSRERKNNSP